MVVLRCTCAQQGFFPQYSGTGGSDSVGINSTARKTECVLEANARDYEEHECSWSETKYSGSFPHKSDKKRAWLKSVRQKLIG